MTGRIPCHVRNLLEKKNEFNQQIKLSTEILPHLLLNGMRVVVQSIDQLIAVAKTVNFLVHLPKGLVQAILLCVRQVNIGNGLFRDVCLQ